MAGIRQLRLGGGVRSAPARLAGLDELSRVHDPSYLEELAAYCERGGGWLDPDTFATGDSWTTARQAAGVGLSVVDELRRQGEGVGFVVARPPGHHAVSDRPLGFCLLNNVAVAAASLLAGGDRVCVFDWDVHHGNGTQAIFWDEPNVLYVSFHQWPLFPGTGSAEEIGGPGARGTTVNVPLPAGATGDVVDHAWEDVALPAIEAFEPDWLLVSAGFDAHRDDPLAELALSAGDFARLARSVAGVVARPGRLALFLEGGYDLAALQASVAATVASVLDIGGDDPGADGQPPTAGGPGHGAVERAKSARRRSFEEGPAPEGVGR
jgi:acetoin utilization deacetylase AcuC-like enzyme